MLKQNTQQELDKFGAYVVKQARANLTRRGHNSSKSLYNSLAYKAKASKNSFQLDFEMEAYGQFQDKGVKGKTSSLRAPNSPFKFGTGSGKKGGLTEAIKDWVRRKSFRMIDKETGRPMGFKAKAFIITRAIYNKGIKPTNFFSRPFDLAYERLPVDLVEAFGLDVESFLKQTLKNG